MKKCPYCAEDIQEDAKKCKYCGEFLSEKPQENKEIQIKCTHCQKMISINATTCPYCNKKTGIPYSFCIGGGILGLITSLLYLYISIEGKDNLSSLLVDAGIPLLFRPAFVIGICVFFGGIIGTIIGSAVVVKKSSQ